MRAVLLAGLVLAVFPAAAQADFTAKRDGFTLRITGDDSSERLALRLAPGAPGTLQVDSGDDGTVDFEFDRATFNAIVVSARGGDDAARIDQLNGAFTDEVVTLDGGAGADTLTGGAGGELLVGGSGNDTVDGNLGVDLARLGSGNDTFNWDPGDSSDTVEGQGGTDELAFNASNAGETIELSADGPHVRLLRNIGNVAMDLDGIEGASLRTLGSSDTVVVNDLTGTEMDAVEVDLGADGLPDTVTARGTEGDDAFVAGASGITGVGARTSVTGADATGDVFGLAALGGADTITSGIDALGSAVVTVDGGADADALRYSGTVGDDLIPLVANGAFAAVATTGTGRIDALVEDIAVLAGRGADQVSAVGNLAALTRITMDGGSGDDTLRGGNGADTLIGGTGNDAVDGNQGLDVAELGSGNDRFMWDPGDGNDTVEGQTGTDALDFNGSAIGEIVEASANGERVRFTRNIANIVMDLAGVEVLSPRLRGGADNITVNDLRGTDVDSVQVDMSTFADNGAGDGQPDVLTARGTDGADAIKVDATGVTGVGARTSITGGADATGDVLGVAALGEADTITTGIGIPGTAAVHIDGGDGADVTRYSGTAGDDVIPAVSNGAFAAVAPTGSALVNVIAVEDLILLGGGGADELAGVGNLAALTRMTFDGGAGDDTIRGGNGADTLIGGTGNDAVDGNQGLDTALLGSGNDTFAWDPGDGNDTVEGQSGADTFAFNGSAIGELLEVAANGERVRFTRNIANIVTDLDDVERMALRALGGADNVTVNSLAGTDLDAVDVDLSAPAGGGDLAQDTVIVNGTDAADAVKVNRVGDAVAVTGLAAQTGIAGSESLNDTLRINTLAGDDKVTIDPNAELLITPVIDLGADG